jgi:hypothetical protein
MYVENTEKEKIGYVVFKGTAKFQRRGGGMIGINRKAIEYYISVDF